MKKNKMDKFQKYATIGIFLLLIFAPSSAWIFLGPVMGDDKSENKTLAAMPDFNLANIENFPKQFEKYYNDHAPFRGGVRTIWSNLNYHALDDSISNMVVLGKFGDSAKDRWLFYSRITDHNPVEEVQSFNKFSDSTVKNAVKTVGENAQHFDESGRAYYFFAIPNKENVYREYLPDNIKIFDEKSQSEKLLDKLSESYGDKIIYAKDEIMRAKAAGVGQLYFKQDTHWNELGAFYGFMALMKRIEPDFTNFDYELTFAAPQMSNIDLAKIINMGTYFTDPRVQVSYLPDKTFTEEKISDEMKVETNNNAVIDKTIMVVGDSYRSQLNRYLGKVFSKVVSMHKSVYNTKFLEQYNPDIVISEAVERYISVTGNFRLY